MKHAKELTPSVSTAEQVTSGKVPKIATCAPAKPERPPILKIKLEIQLRLVAPHVQHCLAAMPAKETNQHV